MASIRGALTVLQPGSTVVAFLQTRTRWLTSLRDQLLAEGALEEGGHGLLRLTTYVTFKSVGAATTFVTGGASVSARLAWLPDD